MKKLFSIILCLCMVCTAAGGCGSGSSSAPSAAMGSAGTGKDSADSKPSAATGSSGTGQGKSSSAAKAEPSVPPEDIAASGVDYGLNWYITKSGHLSVTGHMDPALASRLESFKEERTRAVEELKREIADGQRSPYELVEEYNRTTQEQTPWPWIKDNHATEIRSASLKFTGATDLSSLFSFAENLQKADLTGLDTGKVTDMGGMFGGCSSLSSLDLGSFDTGKVTDMGGMFAKCSSLTSLDLGSFDTGKVTNMNGMFAKCSSLTSLDLGSFDTRNVTDMQDMFYDCSSLKEILVGNGWKEPEKKDDMFYGYGVKSVTRK